MNAVASILLLVAFSAQLLLAPVLHGHVHLHEHVDAAGCGVAEHAGAACGGEGLSAAAIEVSTVQASSHTCVFCTQPNFRMAFDVPGGQDVSVPPVLRSEWLSVPLSLAHGLAFHYSARGPPAGFFNA